MVARGSQGSSGLVSESLQGMEDSGGAAGITSVPLVRGGPAGWLTVLSEYICRPQFLLFAVIGTHWTDCTDWQFNLMNSGSVCILSGLHRPLTFPLDLRVKTWQLKTN